VVSETESLMLRILENIQRDLHAMREYMESGFAAVVRQGDRRFLNHEGRIRVLERDVRTMKAEMGLGFRSVNSRLDGVDSRLDGVETHLRAIDSALVEIKTRLPPKR
jgi:hypothetical protein